MTPTHESFTEAEREVLARHFTTTDTDVFALVNLPDVVKGALFARYSRSAKSLRRLLLDEFYRPEMDTGAASAAGALGIERAEELYERMLVDYGDDSVAQLVGVHVAVEGASNILTKVIEWGRLMNYLEQSTRYVPYNGRVDGRWRYHVPAELRGAAIEARFVQTMDRCFETYDRWFEPLQAHLKERFPKQPGDTNFIYRQSIRAKACDILRGLLPAATTSNVGIFGTAQAFEALLLRLQSHPLAEARDAGEQILVELRKVIPVFMSRIDQPERGGAWSRYLRETADATAGAARRVAPAPDAAPAAASVVLTDFDPDGELKVVAAALYPHTDATDERLTEAVRAMPRERRDEILRACIGDRTNRRHKPGRAFERTSYRFDVVADYGAFRDLQRHRLLTLDWQPLSPRLGYDVPTEAEELGAAADWHRVMADCASIYGQLEDTEHASVAPYAVPMAQRVRFYMQMNAREAMHMIELRTTPQAHRSYRWVCREMYRLIDEEAKHHAIAAAMTFVGAEGDVNLERLDAERAAEAKRQALAARMMRP